MSVHRGGSVDSSNFLKLPPVTLVPPPRDALATVETKPSLFAAAKPAAFEIPATFCLLVFERVTGVRVCAGGRIMGTKGGAYGLRTASRMHARIINRIIKHGRLSFYVIAIRALCTARVIDRRIAHGSLGFHRVA